MDNGLVHPKLTRTRTCPERSPSCTELLGSRSNFESCCLVDPEMPKFLLRVPSELAPPPQFREFKFAPLPGARDSAGVEQLREPWGRDAEAEIFPEVGNPAGRWHQAGPRPRKHRGFRVARGRGVRNSRCPAFFEKAVIGGTPLGRQKTAHTCRCFRLGPIAEIGQTRPLANFSI